MPQQQISGHPWKIPDQSTTSHFAWVPQLPPMSSNNNRHLLSSGLIFSAFKTRYVQTKNDFVQSLLFYDQSLQIKSTSLLWRGIDVITLSIDLHSHIFKFRTDIARMSSSRTSTSSPPVTENVGIINMSIPSLTFSLFHSSFIQQFPRRLFNSLHLTVK